MHSQTLISPRQANTANNDSKRVFLDTRDPEDYHKGHIPGAVNVRDFFTFLTASDPAGYDEIRSRFAVQLGAAGLSGEEMAVVYEDRMDNGFGQSCRGWVLLQALGYDNARILDGGLSAWKAAGLPVTDEPPASETRTFPVNEAAIDAIFITKEQMLAALDDPRIKVLDVRDQDEWEGLSSSPYGVDFAPRKGRLPSARWLNWSKLMEASGRYLPDHYTISMLRGLGIERDDSIYLYCFKGARASNSYVALKNAGFEDVRLYFASWNEWSRDPSLPVDSEVLSVL